MNAPGLSTPQLFALALAESRGAWRRFVFFIFCLAIGVGAVMCVKSFATLLERAVQNESKNLLAADIEVSGSWKQSQGDLAFQKNNLPAGTKFLFIKELHAMALFDPVKRAGKTESTGLSNLLVELKALPTSGPLYPMYGKLKTEPAGALPVLLKNYGALVEPNFLLRSGLQVGDAFNLGDVRARVAGTIHAEPDRITRAFSIGPRVMVSLATLNDSRLVRAGSRIKHRTRIQLPPGADLDRAAAVLENGLKDRSVNVRTYKSAQTRLTKSIERIGEYLGSVGIIALLLGGVGAAMIVRVFMAQKMDSIAILNCLGAAPKTIFKVYLLQALILGGVGSLLGVGLGYVLQFLLPAKLPGLLNLDVQPVFLWEPALQALALGLAITLLFSLWPLIRAAKTRPLRLFRHIAEEEELAKGSRKERWLVGLIFAAGLCGVVFWQAGSMRRGLVFLAALVVSVLVLEIASRLTLKILRKLPPSASMTRRYGLANLYRPNNQAAAIITALGMGIMLVLTVRLVQSDTIAMLNRSADVDPPSFFFIDIQNDQKETFLKTLKDTAPGAEAELIPLIRSRLHSIDEKRTDQWVYKNRQAEEWFITREFVLTVGEEKPPRDNEVIEGKWWTPEEGNAALVSLEQDAARRLGAKIGSTFVIDIQGIKVSAKVSNIRKVNWRNMRTNFYMIYSKGALEGAPLTYVATVKLPREEEPALQKAVVQALPNLTALSTRDIVETVKSVTGKLTTLVDFMSAFTIAAGLIILSGAVASTKFRRMKESAILKTLGASRKTVAGILGYEYAALGLVAGFVGVGLSALLSWAVMKYLIKSQWHVYPEMMLWSFAIAVALTTLTGALSSLDVLRNKPLHTLRRLSS